MAKKKKNTKLVLGLIGIIFLIVIYLFYFFFQYMQILEQITSTKGYIRMFVQGVSTDDGTSLILLKNGCKELTFYTTDQQGASIQAGSSREIPFRPTTHDIMKSLINRFDIDPVIVKITKLEGGTYFAELTLRRSFQFMTVDLKPSDAVALAVRTDAPVYVREGLTEDVC